MDSDNHNIDAVTDEELERAQSLRVAFFSDSLPERNGTGAYYHDLAEQLSPWVKELALLQPKGEARFKRLALPLPGDPTQQLMTPNIFRIRRRLKALQPNVIVSVTPGPFGLLGQLMARSYGCAFVSGFHTNFEGLAELYWRPLQRRIITAYLRGASRFLCKRSRSVLINNSELEQTVAQLGATRVDIIGTPLQGLFVDTPTKALPARLQQVCFAGRLAAEKNVSAFIDAADRFPDVRFVIGGDGPERAAIEQAATQRSNLDYRGWLSRRELVELIDDSSLLVLPSHLETFGSVALEAMARGRPALVSANAGIHDWPQLSEGLFRLEKNETVCDALGQILSNEDESLVRRATAARPAALALNEATIRHWAALLARYSD